MTTIRTLFAVLAAVLITPLPSLASQPHHAALASDAGTAGDPASVVRSVDVGMFDTMRFSPDQLTVARGQTIRFNVRNKGKVRHEIVLGTRDDIARHRQAMQQDPGMAHAAPHMAHVAPGGRERLIWRFDRAGQFEFACLLPGHYEAGMRGTIAVQ